MNRPDLPVLAFQLLHGTINDTAAIHEARDACRALDSGDLTGALVGLNAAIEEACNDTAGTLAGRPARERQRLLTVAQIARVLVLDTITADGGPPCPAEARPSPEPRPGTHPDFARLAAELLRDTITSTLTLHEAHADLISPGSAGAIDAAYLALHDHDHQEALHCLDAAIRIASEPVKPPARGHRAEHRTKSMVQERQHLLTIALVSSVLVLDALKLVVAA